MPREATVMAGPKKSEERRAAALRENLKRRKRQMRQRQAGPQIRSDGALEPPDRPDRKG